MTYAECLLEQASGAVRGRSIWVIFGGASGQMSDESQLDAGRTTKGVLGDVAPMLVRHIGRVSAVFDGARIGVSIWSCDGQMLHANPVMCELTAKPVETLVGQEFRTFLDPDDADAMEAMFDELVSGARAAFECNLRCRHGGGSDQWLRAHVTGIFGGGRSPEYLISQIFDFVDVRSRVGLADVRADPSRANRGLDRWDKARQAVPLTTFPHKRWREKDDGRCGIMEDIHIAVAACDRNGSINWANRRWKQIFQGDAISAVATDAPSSVDREVRAADHDSINPRDWFDRVVNVDKAELRAKIADVAETGERFTVRVSIIPPVVVGNREPSVGLQGHEPTANTNRSPRDPKELFWGDLTVSLQTDPVVDGELVMTLIDVSTEMAIGSRLNQLAHALDAGTDYLLFMERDLTISYANDAACEMLGLPSQFADSDPLQLTDLLGADGAEFFHDVVNPALVFDAAWRGELEMTSTDGRAVPVSAVFQAHSDGDGRIESISVVARDISDLKAAQIKLQALATHDYLTGLANRVLLYSQLEQALGRLSRYGHAVTLMYIDLDEFKPVNDKLGHHVGDEVLIAVADRIHSVIRMSDSAARLGGDEFAILIEGIADSAQHKRMADRLIAQISEPVPTSGGITRISASIGIAQADATCTTPDALMMLADGAMYKAKAAGRGCSVMVDVTGQAIA